MGTFAIDWLNLREPVDHRSVNAVVRKCFTHAVAHHDALNIVDLGSGAGSNMRGLSPWLPQQQSWTLVDFDQSLLDAAAAQPRLRNVTVETHRSDLATADLSDIVARADVVTAAAFFDIASLDLVDRIVSATVAVVDGRVPVLAPVGSGYGTARELARRAERAGGFTGFRIGRRAVGSTGAVGSGSFGVLRALC